MSGFPPSPRSIPSGWKRIVKVATSQQSASSIACTSSSEATAACSIVRMPARAAVVRPGPPCAWAATYVPARSASSTAARISS